MGIGSAWDALQPAPLIFGPPPLTAATRLRRSWNTHFSTVVEQELFGLDFQLAQDPNSSNLGTTVWDASIVLAKYIEKNSRRGDFCRPKIRGKRALELGAGMGLAGMALALLGAEVTFTDIGDVLPLLRRNVEQNISKAALKLKDAAWVAAEVGAATVASLDWSDPACYSAFRPPYDFILAADCVYSELAVPHLLATVLHMGGPRTQTIITNEFRSQTVHDLFMEQFGCHFTIRKVPVGKQHENYNHPLIHIYLLKRRKQPLGAEAKAGSEAGSTEAGEGAAAVTEAGEGAAAVTEAGEGAAAVTEAGDGATAVAAAGEGAAAAAGGGAALPGEVESAQLAEADAAAAAGGGSEGDEEPPSPPAGGEAASGDKHADQFQTRRMGVMLAKSLKHVTI